MMVKHRALDWEFLFHSAARRRTSPWALLSQGGGKVTGDKRPPEIWPSPESGTPGHITTAGSPAPPALFHFPGSFHADTWVPVYKIRKEALTQQPSQIQQRLSSAQLFRLSLPGMSLCKIVRVPSPPRTVMCSLVCVIFRGPCPGSVGFCI